MIGSTLVAYLSASIFTAFTALLRANWSRGLPRVAAITGHSPRDVDEIHLGGQPELAEQATVKLVATFGQ
jgi:hypothetical protein